MLSGGSISGRKRPLETEQRTGTVEVPVEPSSSSTQPPQQKQDATSTAMHDNDIDKVTTADTSSLPSEPEATATTSTTTPSFFPFTTIHKLQLEAIFHPKFENEQSNSAVCGQMKERVALGKGYLEVTVKHSGSLLLWSGGERYYSKNSTDNRFTWTGQVLLRQHFARAFWNTTDISNDNLSEHALVASEAAYQRCSDHVQKHGLTLSFEVVTTYLGDHGDRPKHDFLILTAVADRTTERFYSTVEVVQFCHQFRLPHNDAWICSSETAVEKLLGWYDVARETGTASTVVAALHEAAQVHVPSMYPHSTFQGDIMEGIVIRYVPCCLGDNTNSTDATSVLEQMQSLAAVSKRLLELVPPDRKPCHELVQQWQSQQQLLAVNNNNLEEGWPVVPIPPVLACDIRAFVSNDFYDTNDDTTLDEKLLHILQSSGSRRSVKRLTGDAVDIPSMLLTQKTSLSLCESALFRDDKSRRIARLIQTLSALNDKVSFNVDKETTTTTTTTTAPLSHNDDNNNSNVRWLCTIHVKFDTTFQKFRNRSADDPSSMKLFRGFVIELDPKQHDDKKLPTEAATEIEETSTMSTGSNKQDEEEPPLMLKMKFLPYMVRTFACRNGLRTVRQGGPQAFSSFTAELLNRWDISPQGRAKWQPFFEAWGEYAHSVFQWQRQQPVADDHGSILQQPTVTLTERNYLTHLYYFKNLYDTGKLSALIDKRAQQTCRLQGIVVVVSTQLETADLVADFLAEQLGGARRNCGFGDLTKSLLDQSCVPGRGRVFSVSADQGAGGVKKFIRDYGHYITLVLFQMSNDDIDAAFSETDRKVRGMARTWAKLRCKTIFSFALDALFRDDKPTNDDIHPNDEFRNMISALSQVQEYQRPGILVFFPGIPGCGKSCLTGPETESELKKSLVEMSNDKQQRNLMIISGDTTKGKYWPHVRDKRMRDTSCVVIADKNAPLSALSTVGNVCMDTKAFGVPVLPDDLALQTTEVHGIRNYDESEIEERKHIYPFSLAYLAVCLARVIGRPAGMHDGKLDSGTPRACFVVVKFFGLYRRISAEGFLNQVHSNICNSGGLVFSPIQVPFFKAQCEKLPPQLEELLVDILRVQFAADRNKIDIIKEESKELDDLEHRLRACIEEHREFLSSLVDDELSSRRRFVSQLVERVAECDTLSVYASEKPPFIKLVAIDVKKEDVHRLLLGLKENKYLASFFGMVLDGRTAEEVFSVESKMSDRRVISRTHVTLAHFTRVSQGALRELYGPLSGLSVRLFATSLLWSNRIAAISVDVDSSSKCGKQIPPSTNDFSHITVFVQNGSSAVESNLLPELVETGQANRFEFSAPILLDGSISLWDT